MQEHLRVDELQARVDDARRALQRARERLYARCPHPNDRSYRGGGLYAEREWHCPDCGREL